MFRCQKEIVSNARQEIREFKSKDNDLLTLTFDRTRAENHHASSIEIKHGENAEQGMTRVVRALYPHKDNQFDEMVDMLRNIPRALLKSNK